MDLGAATLPQLPRDSGDRNRTSPFAFTGNKFEFRAVGSSATSAWPNTVMNTIVAESLDEIANQLEAAVGPNPTQDKLMAAVRGVLQKTIKEHKRVIFNGDGYSAEWHAEAERRGLPHLRDSVAAIPRFATDRAVRLFEKYQVLNRQELESRVTAYLERYCKQILIESETMVMMGRQMILPAAIAQESILAEAVTALRSAGVDHKERQAMLEQFMERVRRFTTTLEGLAEADNLESHEPLEHAKYLRDQIIPLMQVLRAAGDDLENHVPAVLWPLPSYREILYLK